MEQPLGFKDSIFLNHVRLIKKALYALKQSPPKTPFGYTCTSVT